MQTLQNILSQEMVQKLGWTLVHFIWQGAVIALLCAIVLRLMRKSSSNLRYTVAFIALAIMVIAPMITIKMIHISIPGANPVLIKANNLQAAEPTKTIKIDLPQDTNIKPAAPVKQSLKDRFTKTIETLLPHIVVCWLIGVVVLSIWYLGGWTQLQKLRRQMTTPVSKEIKTKLNQLSKILGINKTIDVVQSVLVNVPTVIGHFKPVILLPASTLTGLSAEQIEAILAHELAHIKRCDYLVNIMQTVVEILGFYHPAVWWVSNKIRQERENCCDDIAVQITGDEVNYAQALATMEEIRFSATENTEFTEDINNKKLVIAASGGNLFNRIKRLLGKNISNNEKAGWLPSAIVVLLIAGLLVPMTMTLSSCEKRTLETSMNLKINRIDIDTSTRNDVINVFGEPGKYMWGDEKKKTVEVLDKNKLPDHYIMVYPGNFRVFMINDRIIELRFEGPNDYIFDSGLVVGSSLEKAFRVLGEPKEIIDGKPNEFHKNVFYKNINGKKGYGYYAVPEKNVRIWIEDNKVRAIYLTRSNYFERGPSRKLRDDELSKDSVIDANGNIVDKLDYPFVRDFYVIGTWKSVDYVREIDDFKPGKQAWIWGDLFLKELVFKEDGTLIAKNGNAPKGYRAKWTKGLVLYDNDQKTASKYTIKEINGSTYMFYEWKSGDYTIRHQKPSYYVLKKVEDETNVVKKSNEVDISNNKITSVFNEFIKAVQNNDEEGLRKIAEQRADAYKFDDIQKQNELESLILDANALRTYKGIENLTVASIEDTNTLHIKNVITNQVVDARGISGRLMFTFFGKSEPVLETIHFIEDSGRQLLLRPQILTKMKFITFKSGNKLFKDLIASEHKSLKYIAPQENEKIMAMVRADKDTFNLASPMVLANDGEEVIMKVGSIEFKIVNYAQPDRKSINSIFEFKYICNGTQKTFGELSTFMPSGTALLVRGDEPCDGNEAILIVYPEILKAGQNLGNGLVEGNSTPAKDFKQELEKPVTVKVEKSPDGDRLTIQYAVIAICKAAGVPYNWDESVKLASPQRTKYIDAFNIENKVAGQAIADLIGPVGLSYGVNEKGVYLYKPEKIQSESNFEILDVNFEPIRQGKNVLNIKVKNRSDKEQLLGLHIYTRSVDYGPNGIGWGTIFFDRLKANETKVSRFAYKIQGPVTENTYVRLRYYNPASEKEYNYDDKPFLQKNYTAKELPFFPVVVKEWTNDEMAQDVLYAFETFQKAIKDNDYEKAWNIFTDDYKKSEYQLKGFKAFKSHMEPKHPLEAGFHWDKEILTKLKWSGIDVSAGTIEKYNGPILEAKYEDQKWYFNFIHDSSTGTWKIDDITGYIPGVIKIQEQDLKK